MNAEQALQVAVSNYLWLQYNHVIFTAEGAGIYQSKASASISKMMRSESKLPDLWMMEPMNGYHGLFIELKADGVIVYRQDGSLTANARIRSQAAIIERLKNKGYWASFAIGFDQAKKLIDWYMTPNGVFKQDLKI